MAEGEDLDTIVVELYAVPPADFTTARSERARGLDKDLAARVAKVRKPVVSAWVVDLLAREGMLADALELGAALREAQDDLDAAELSRLGRQRRQLVAALARSGGDRAADAGVAVSAAALTDIESTLNAALIDATAAAAVRTARLAKPIAAGGDLDLADVLSGSAPLPQRDETPDDELAERRARKAAESAAREAERAADRAARDQTDAEAKRDRAQVKADGLETRVDALRRELEQIEAEASAARADLDALIRAAAEAAEQARTAARRAKTARAAVDPA